MSLRPVMVCLFVLAASIVVGEDPQPAKYQGTCTSSGCHGDYTQRKFIHAPISQGACDACHEPIPDKEHQFRLVKKGAELCTECHESVTEDMPFIHGPVAVGECTVCHNPHASDHRPILRDQESKVCLDCHENVQEKLESSKVVHRPATSECLACHKGHGGKNKLFLTADAPKLCYECHEEIGEMIESGTVKHSAVAEDRSCMSCHDAHASAHGKLLVEQESKVCLACHKEELAVGDRKISNIAAKLASHPHHHGPLAGGECGACHNPHGGSREHLLARSYPPKIYAPFDVKAYDLCLECHEAEAFTEKETDSATGFRNGDRNLHHLHVNMPAKGRTCRMCHDPHASNNAKHMVESTPFGRWEIPINFKETATGGSCMPGCHAPQKYDRDNPIADPNAQTAASP